MFVTISHSLFSYIHAAFCHLNWWTCWCAIIFQCVLLLKIISMPWSHHMLKHNLEESGRLLCMIKRIDKIYQFEIWDDDIKLLSWVMIWKCSAPLFYLLGNGVTFHVYKEGLHSLSYLSIFDWSHCPCYTWMSGKLLIVIFLLP